MCFCGLGLIYDRRGCSGQTELAFCSTVKQKWWTVIEILYFWHVTNPMTPKGGWRIWCEFTVYRAFPDLEWPWNFHRWFWMLLWKLWGPHEWLIPLRVSRNSGLCHFSSMSVFSFKCGRFSRHDQVWFTKADDENVKDSIVVGGIKTLIVKCHLHSSYDFWGIKCRVLRFERRIVYPFKNVWWVFEAQ